MTPSRAISLLPLLALLAGCAGTPALSERAACQHKMEALSERLLPAFAKLGYEPRVRISVDDDLANARGFPSPPQVYGDTVIGGRIRVRPLLCDDDVLASIVVAHEMSHAALKHMGSVPTGVNLAWETPKSELEADALARKVLQESGAPQPMLDYLTCRLGQCNAVPKGWKHKPVGTRGEGGIEAH